MERTAGERLPPNSRPEALDPAIDRLRRPPAGERQMDGLHGGE
jgi:hypothetical protein